MGSVGDSYRCPLCGRKGRGSDANACVGYPICTVGANSCLGKILTPPGSNPCDIVGAALRCILKGTALFLQEYICKNVGECLTPNKQMVALLYKHWWRSVLSSKTSLSDRKTDGFTSGMKANLVEDALHDCLSWCLNNLGAQVPTGLQGPFRVLKDANTWLAHSGLRLVKQHEGPLLPGKYIKWQPRFDDLGRQQRVGHFKAVVLDRDIVDIRDRLGTQTYRLWGEIPGVEQHKWFRLVDLNHAEGNQPQQPVCVRGTVPEIVEINRLNALFRRDAARKHADANARWATLTPEQFNRIETHRQEALERRKLRLIRPHKPVKWPVADVPTAPQDFSHELPHLPKLKLLARLNAHVRDPHLQFFEEAHIYYIRGVRTHGSVTGVIHEYSQEFDARGVIGKMRCGHNWPRPDYLRHPYPSQIIAQLERMTEPEAVGLHTLLVSHFATEADICAAVKALTAKLSHLHLLVDGLSLSEEEIIEKWRRNGEEAARRGTWMHWTFEAYLNREAVPDDSAEFRLFLCFLKTLGGLTAFRTEWAIFADEEGLAGSIDFVAQDPTGKLVIFDWKRSKNLRTQYDSRWGQMKGPLHRLPDCKGQHYRIQLNVYRWILQHYYDVHVAGMFVVCLHPDNGDSAFIDTVPVIPEVEELMAIQRLRSRELRAMALEDIHEMDPLGGSPTRVVVPNPEFIETTSMLFR